MHKIGITGGIGSGKTSVCKIFETLGIPVYYADDRAKWLMTNNEDLKQEIIQIFGQEAYLDDGQLNRAHIGSIAFQNADKLKQLNAAVHPAVAKDGADWHYAQQDVPYTLKEAALLYEAGSYKQMDKIIVVTAPEATRIERVIKRDQTTAEAVKARIDKQMPQEEKVQRADFVIHNDGEQSLIHQVLSIHQQLLKL
jgi:dephospho-CoA kinase